MTRTEPGRSALGRAVDPTVMTPSVRLLWWLKASFVGDAALAALGGLVMPRNEEAGWFLLVCAAVRAARRRRPRRTGRSGSWP